LDNNFTVRTAVPDDLESLIGFVISLFSIEKDFMIDCGKIEAGLMELIYCGNGEVFVVEKDGESIGMASAQRLISTAAGGVSILVEDVYIKEEFRGIGAGKILMEFIESWGIQNGALRMQLVADRNNKGALEFYRRLGWNDGNMSGLYRYL
jgi:GNAT superfamily N-acetyltransferase